MPYDPFLSPMDAEGGGFLVWVSPKLAVPPPGRNDGGGGFPAEFPSDFDNASSLSKEYSFSSLFDEGHKFFSSPET